MSETWWTLVPYRPFYKLYSIPKAQKLSANIPKSLFLKELLSPNGTVTALLEQLESYLKSLRSFLSAWPGHLSSMPKRIPLFRCGNLFFYSSWGRVLPWFSPGTCLLPTPWFKCFPRSCPWPSSLFFCPLSLGNLLQSQVSNNCHIKDSQPYTHKLFCIPFTYVLIYILWNSTCLFEIKFDTLSSRTNSFHVSNFNNLWKY